MPRHGATRETKRNKHQGHRIHRRTRLERLAARTGRSTRPWDRDAWLDRMRDEALAALLVGEAVNTAALAELEQLPPLRLGGRKNKPQERPQEQKKSGRGGRGGKGGGGRQK